MAKGLSSGTREQEHSVSQAKIVNVKGAKEMIVSTGHALHGRASSALVPYQFGTGTVPVRPRYRSGALPVRY